MIKSFSKLNLSLKILKKFKNGMHDIESNAFLINIYDEITIKKINNFKDIISFRGPFAKMVDEEENTIKHTLEILRSKKIIKNIYKITIFKKIPVFGGLGGGSSNSAFLINYLVKRPLDKSILKTLYKKVGSDLRLFKYDQSFQKNLKKVIPYKKKYKIHILLIYPKLKCSTQNIYSKVKKIKKTPYLNFSAIKTKKKLIEFLKKENNDLESIVIKKFPKIKMIIKFIGMQEGCNFSRITGSGSTCFGVFKNHRLAKEALIEAKKKYPNYWCEVTKTI